MKAAAQDQWKLLDLARTDRLIARAQHRRQTLPELAELKDLAVQRRALAEEVVAKSNRSASRVTSSRPVPAWIAIRRPSIPVPSPTTRP